MILADSSASRTGVILGIVAYVFWGLFPIYLKLVASVAPLEVLWHRIVWAVAFGAVIIALRRQWSGVRTGLTRAGGLGWLMTAALMISINWFVYIWAVHNERIFEASLGYYINPLIYVLVGVLFFGDVLSAAKRLAVVLAAIGVSILAIGGDTFPWVALILGTSFTLYGVIRKKVFIGAMPALFVETLLLFPIAIAGLAWMLKSGTAAFLSGSQPLNLLLILAGPVTLLPLLFFAIAAKRLTLTTVGFMQFIAPTLQFATGLYFGETLTTAHVLCFGFIWTAVLIFVADVIRENRKKPPQALPAGAGG